MTSDQVWGVIVTLAAITIGRAVLTGFKVPPKVQIIGALAILAVTIAVMIVVNAG